MNTAIVRRELVGLLRSPRALAVEVGLAVLWTMLVLLRWPTDGLVALAGAQSQQVFLLLSYGLLAAVVLLAPIVPAGSIVSEKRRGTLAMLLISPLSAWSIYVSKLAAALGLVGLMLATSIPAVVACHAMGGLSLTRDVLPLYGLLLIVAVQMATLGLVVSSYASTIDAALRFTFGGLLLITVVPLGPALVLQGSDNMLAAAARWLRHLSPLPAVMQLVGQRDVGSQGVINTSDDIWGYVGVTGPFIVVCAALTIRRLSQTMLDRPRAAGQMTDDRSVGVRSVRRLFFLVDPQRRKTAIRRWMNPVMVKEFRCRQFGRLHWLMRLIAGCAVLSLTLTYAATLGAIGWNAETIGGILVTLQVALLIFLTPSLASGIISTELETGGWNLLRVTPLSARRIVTGKLLSVAWTLLLILCATLPGYAVMIAIKPALTVQVRQVLICLVLTALLAALLSAVVSSFFRRTAAATAVAYALLLGLVAGTLLIWLGRDAPFGHRLVEQVLAWNPMAAALSIIGTPGFEQYRLVPTNWWRTGGVCASLLLILGVRTWKLTLPE